MSTDTIEDLFATNKPWTAKKQSDVLVRQSSKIDYTKMPTDDGRVYLQVTGGEALKICQREEERMEEWRKASKELFNQVRRQVVPTPKKATIPLGGKVTLQDFSSKQVTLEIRFKRPKDFLAEKRASDEVVQAYREFINADIARIYRLSSGAFSAYGDGVVNVRLTIRHDTTEGRELRKQIKAHLGRQIDSRSIADKLLAKTERRCGGTFHRFAGAGRIAVPTAGLFGGVWILSLPVDHKKPPAEIHLPRGTFKRLLVSQFWRLRERVAAEA